MTRGNLRQQWLQSNSVNLNEEQDGFSAALVSTSTSSSDWHDYFQCCVDLVVNSINFRVYYSLNIHQISPLTANDSTFSQASFPTEPNARLSARNDISEEPPFIILIHGAGLCALSWALCAKEIVARGFPVFAMDLRSHGDSQIELENTMSLDNISNDVALVFKATIMHHINSNGNINILSEEVDRFIAKRGVYLVGHSFGGAIAASIITRKLIPSIYGIALIDCIEGVALQALDTMPSLISNRPPSFNTMDEAIEWSIAVGLPRNQRAAKISVPKLVKAVSIDNDDGRVFYKWRTQLLETRRFWRDWFHGLNEAFLSAPCGRLVIVTKESQLDKALTIAQMQGKFKHVIVPESGHHVQEDNPIYLAEVIAEFARRNMPLRLPVAAQRPS